MNNENPAGTTAQMDDQARMEVAMAAGMAERANQPRGLIILAGLVLAGSIVYAALGISARAAAAVEVQSERSQSQSITKLVEKVRSLQASQALRGLEPNSRMAKLIEDLAAEEGLTADSTDRKLVVSESDVTGISVPGIAQKKYTAKMTGQIPAAILRWLSRVQTDETTRGVEISNFNLRPEAQSTRGAWNLDIEFVRWERR